MKIILVLFAVIYTAISVPYYERYGNYGNYEYEYPCAYVRCRRPLCANPQTQPRQCCPSCENSGCKFRGCVNFRADDTVQWQPDPCTTCHCVNNNTVCAAIGCAPLTREDCFGYPVITRPNECCPSCDFGIKETKCGVVPAKTVNITVISKHASDSSRCSEIVRKHECDKIGFRKKSQYDSKDLKFRCEPIFARSIVRFKRNDCPLRYGGFDDVDKCKPVHDDDIIVGCDFTVP